MTYIAIQLHVLRHSCLQCEYFIKYGIHKGMLYTNIDSNYWLNDLNIIMEPF